MGQVRQSVLRRLRIATAVFVAVTVAGAARAQTTDSTSALPPSGVHQAADTATGRSGERPLKWYSMFTNIPRDWLRFGQVTFRSKNIPSFVGMTLLTGALVATDDETWKMSQRWYGSSNVVASFSDQFEGVGDGKPQFALSAAFALYGFASGDQRALRTASEIVEAILSCGIVIQVLKHATGRESPFVSTVPGGRWDLLPNQIEYHKHVPRYDAYPSGHIATTLATVTVVAENYPEWKWVRPVGYAIAAGVAVGMGNTGIHWYSDYPLGLAIGYMFGMLAAHPEGLPAEQEESAQQVTVGPAVSPYGVGVGVTVLLNLHQPCAQ